MPNLGDFTAIMAEADPEPTTFTMHGEVFALQPELTAYAFLKFSALVGEVDITDEEQLGAINMVVMFDILRDAIVPEDWDRFQRTIRDQRVSVPTVMTITSAIMENATGRPTVAPSVSGGASSTTSRQSSARRSGSSAGKAKKRKKEVAARSVTVREAESRVTVVPAPPSTADRIAAAVEAGEMTEPTEDDSRALASVLGLQVGGTGSTGSARGSS